MLVLAAGPGAEDGIWGQRTFGYGCRHKSAGFAGEGRASLPTLTGEAPGNAVRAAMAPLPKGFMIKDLE